VQPVQFCEWEASVAGQEGHEPHATINVRMTFQAVMRGRAGRQRTAARGIVLVVGALAVTREIEAVAFARFGDAGTAEDGLDNEHGNQGNHT
jgi:hypothetical protein